ncbi:MAG: heparan-alpha-glucosaminide N-acetyltransferase domain-containing protein [Polyangia bacterium]|jgi:uncharacterized membrane protein
MAKRLAALDVQRGLIMMLMALDHVVAFVYRYHPSEVWAGAWTRYTAWQPFVTRLVTHLCAPGFFLLMGCGVALLLESRIEQGWSDSEARRFLCKRGLLLLLLNQLIENRAWTLGFRYSEAAPPAIPDGPWPGPSGPMVLVFSVLSGLGMALILSSLLLRLRTRYLAIVATLVIVASAILTPGPAHLRDSYGLALRLLFLPGHSGTGFVLYPIIPWSGVALWGIVLGRQLHAHAAPVLRKLPWLGLAMVLSALTLRAVGGPGNLRLPRDSSVIEFFNLIKYPPSLVFLLLFVGTNLLLLSLWNRIADKLPRVSQILSTFGQVPLFYYLLHLFLFCGIGSLFFRKGASLPVTYLVWLLGLIPLYFACRAYQRFKSQTPVDSLWRFF